MPLKTETGRSNQTRCLATGTQTPVTLTGDTYTCPACGFSAQVRRVKLGDILWGAVDVKPARVWWAGGEAHCIERTS